MAFFQSPGRVPLFIVMSSSRARYGKMASPPRFRIPTETPSGLTELFFPIAAIFFVMILVSMVKGSLDILSCIFGILSSLLNTE